MRESFPIFNLKIYSDERGVAAMKNIKKLFAVIMIMGTMLSFSINVSAVQLYEDIPADHELAEVVYLLYKLQIMWGYG